MIKGGVVETPRMIIRPFCNDDATRLVEIFADPRVARFVDDGAPLPLNEAELWVQKSKENLDRYGYGTGAVTARSDGRIIGWAGFARPSDGEEEVIYGLVADCWGRGYGREILAALVAFGVARGSPILRATVDPTNIRSVALLVGQGFSRAARDGADLSCDLYFRSGGADA